MSLVLKTGTKEPTPCGHPPGEECLIGLRAKQAACLPMFKKRPRAGGKERARVFGPGRERSRVVEPRVPRRATCIYVSDSEERWQPQTWNRRELGQPTITRVQFRG